MNDFITLLESKNNGKRKQSSLDQISNNIKRLYVKCYDDMPSDISQIEGMIEDVGHTFACLQSDGWGIYNKKLSISTMLSYTNALIIADDLFEGSNQGTYGDLETTLQVRREDHQRKNPVKTNKISRSELDKLLNSMKDNKTKVGLKGYAILQVIGKYPFRLESATLERIKQSDYDQIEDKGPRNFLIEGEQWKFMFHGYKTNKQYGVREIPVDDELRDTLIELYEKAKILEGDFIFFAGSKDGEYDEGITIEKIQEKQRNNLSVWIKRLLSKNKINASATDITKLLISEIWDNGTVQDKIRFAQWRGHQPATAAKVYATVK